MQPIFLSTLGRNRGILLVTIGWRRVSSRTMDPEKELIDAFERMVRREFLNPERIGCPGLNQLRLLVEPAPNCELSRVLEHVRRCAPCFDELKELRKTRA